MSARDAVTHRARVRGLLRGVALSADATGTPMAITVSDATVEMADDVRMLTIRIGEIDGVGVRSGECVLFIDGGDVIECVGDEAPALGSSLAQVLFAPPELLRAARAPLAANAATRAAWDATMSPLVDAGVVLRRATDVRSAVRDATTAVRDGLERIPLLLLGSATDTPEHRARAARLSDALAPAVPLRSALESCAAAIGECTADVLCLRWRDWVAVLGRLATTLRDQVPAVVQACAVDADARPEGWFSGRRRGR